MNKQIDPRTALAVVLRKDLSSFVQRCFATVDPGSQYNHNWHVDAIAHQLMRIERGEINRLVITIPPRSLKSISTSVAFPAWLLGRDPTIRVLAVSYAESLADKMALDCQKILGAPWYREAFPATRIASGRSARSDFETTRGGGRFSTSVGGALTGRGGDIIILDDPHKPEDVGSETRRKSVLNWYASTLLSRLNNPKSGPIILIQQRVHEADLAGHLLEQGGWEHLDLPAIAQEPEVVDLGWRGAIRRQEGDLLDAERLPRSLLDNRRDELGSYIFAAQYQQRPAPMEGGIVKWRWFRSYDRAQVRASGDQIIQSWDTASKADQSNDYSVCTTWHVHGKTASLLDVFRQRLEFPELVRKIPALAKVWSANQVLIEEAGSGIQLLQELKRSARFKAVGQIPKDDKATRLLSVSHLIENGQIAIPQEASWLASFRQELTLFPNGKYDDQVDSLSQFLRWFAKPKPKFQQLPLRL